MEEPGRLQSMESQKWGFFYLVGNWEHCSFLGKYFFAYMFDIDWAAEVKTNAGEV